MTYEKQTDRGSHKHTGSYHKLAKTTTDNKQTTDDKIALFLTSVTQETDRIFAKSSLWMKKPTTAVINCWYNCSSKHAEEL